MCEKPVITTRDRKILIPGLSTHFQSCKAGIISIPLGRDHFHPKDKYLPNKPEKPDKLNRLKRLNRPDKPDKLKRPKKFQA